MTKKRLLLTNNFVNQADDVIGKIEFADNPKADFVYEMLIMKPESFKFEIGMIDLDGEKVLTQVSIVNKYGDHHPIILKRRLTDRIRVALRRFKSDNGNSIAEIISKPMTPLQKEIVEKGRQVYEYHKNRSKK